MQYLGSANISNKKKFFNKFYKGISKNSYQIVYYNCPLRDEMISEYLRSVWNFCREYPFYAVAFFYGGYLIGVVYF